ncbi:MAG: phage portal protein [Lachnospiraceae bacterium]|nr:phage portal protein [Lachnospiraceae bacterium]
MDVFEIIRNKVKGAREDHTSVGLNDEKLLEWLGISGNFNKPIQEITYFTCLKMLSETVGKMPIKFYAKGRKEAESNQVYYLLKQRPNPIMTPTTFWTTVENNRNHFGNAYVWIQGEFERKKFGGSFSVKGLWIMPSNDVTVIVDDRGIFGGKGEIYYWYSDKYSGESYFFRNYEVLHFKTSTTFDGIMGASVREILKRTIDGAMEAQKFKNNLYEGGMTARAALQYTGDLDPKKEKKLIKRFEQYATGANNAGKFIPVPIGMRIEPLSISMTDSQYYELSKYTALQIAGAFGIKPNQINDYEKSSYSNSEMQQLSFYVDTELYILKQYEEEINYKLLDPSEEAQGLYFKFNENVILRTDTKSQAEILSKYVQNGIRTPNEARALLDAPDKPGGDDLMCNGNYIKLTQLGENYKEKGGVSACRF